MRYPLLKKLHPSETPHRLADYHKTCSAFSWDDEISKFVERGDGALNIAVEAVDRHATGPNADKIAIRLLALNGERTDFTYGALHGLTNQFANALKTLEITKGDRVFILSDRVPELYIGMLGALKNGCVVSPLFSAFGPEPIRVRLEVGNGRVLITTPDLYLNKVKDLRAVLPELEHVILIGLRDTPSDIDSTHDFWSLMDRESTEFDMIKTTPDDMALLHFTSGTTGKPKGAVHCHRAVISHHITGQFALDLQDDDIFWCTADPGWVTGTSYGIISPLTNGVTLLVDQAEFGSEHWYEVLENENVTVWYTAPTAIRMLMKAGADLAHQHDLSNLRFIASVGEPLNPEAVIWGNDAFAMPIHDNWWQTETGGIMIANFASMDIKPGSMGRPLPGIHATLLIFDDEGFREAGDHEEGELALKVGWPSLFQDYLHQHARYERAFIDGWYRSGDIAYRDEDGYFWFVGRADDLIKSAGHLIGPFEVESALIEHPAVAEAGVIGKPHPVAGQIVKAFITLHTGFEANRQLVRDLKAFARKRLGSAVAPRELEIVETLPKTRSGKIMRRLLKARELGLPEGDISTLENGR